MVAMIIGICIRICCKACKPPKFVTGHPSGLFVIPVFNYRYFLRSESTVLKLRENFFSWSGDDCTVKVLISVLRLCTFFIHYTAYCKKTFQSFFIFNQLLIVYVVFYHAGLTLLKPLKNV